MTAEREGGLCALECVLSLKRSKNQSLPKLPKLGPDKNNPHLCDFTGIHYVDKQVKSIEELREPHNLCVRDGSSLTRARQRSCGKHSLGGSDEGPKPQADSPEEHERLPGSPKQCTAVGVTSASSVSGTKTST